MVAALGPDDAAINMKLLLSLYIVAYAIPFTFGVLFLFSVC